MSSDDGLARDSYSALVASVSMRAAEDVRRAASTAKRKSACCRYLKSGKAAGLSYEEPIDFLRVSSPSILDRAGYSQADAQEVMNRLARITDEEIENASV